MRKNLKKILATVLTVATCAVSMTAITSNAVSTYKSDSLSVDTVSFTLGGNKYVLRQDVTDYFDVEDWRFFKSEDDKRELLLIDGSLGLWSFGVYHLKSEEDLVAFTEYLSDNNIPYEETNMKEYTEIHIIRDSYTDDEYFQLLQKIKEDTGHVIGTFQPDLGIRLNSLTDIENVLPAPTLLGDANEDGEVSLADAVFIMQVLSNPDDFQLTPQGMANADTNGDGITVMDALRIQEIQIGL